MLRLHPMAVLAGGLIVLVPFAAPARAQSTRERQSLRAVRTDEAPRIDGVLDEMSWQSATPVDRFTQQEPREGQPATDRTEVRVLYDSRNIYIGVHAFAAEPVVATEMRRDADRLFDEDNFQVIIDTFMDSRNGYMFLTTPLGAKLEQQVFDEGEGGGRGTTSNVNRNWDGVWNSEARITDDGWTAEIAIPTNTVRFKANDEQTWGINFLRHIRRKNEQVFWSPIPRAYSLTRVSLAGQLVGLKGLSLGMDLKLKPFVIAGVRNRQLSATNKSTDALKDVGLDARYGVTAGLNLDVTLNTDFAQVEVDEQQVNLTRFGLFFPEKRDFFLENSNFFTTGTGASFTSTQVQTDLFFSRRIGLSAAGLPIPIIGGARLAGKSGRNSIGMLNVQTGEAFGRPGDNFFVGRYSRDILRRSRVGAILINKETTGGSAHYNRTMGLDANLAIGRSVQLNSYLAKTATPGLDGKDLAFYGRIAYRDPKLNMWLNYLDVQENFNAEVGFVQRRGIRTTKAYFSPTPRLGGKYKIRFMEPMYVVTYMTDQTNRLVYRMHHYMLGTTLQDDSFINVVYQQVLDVLDAPFQIRPDVRIPTGAYKFDEWSFTYNTSPGRKLYSRMQFAPSTFYEGTRRNVTAAVGVRATNRLSSELQYNRNDVKMPFGNFLVNLTSLRVDYTFSPRMTLRSLTQYNTSTHEISNNVRFNFIHRPGSDIYLVYNELRQTGLPSDVFAQKDRQLVLKMNYLVQR